MVKSKNWKGLALQTTADYYCCAVMYMFGFSLNDSAQTVADANEDEYVDFLASQIKAKVGTTYAWFAHLTGSQKPVVHKALLKAGWQPVTYGPDKQNAYWNLYHGPNCIHTYMYLQPNQGTFSIPGSYPEYKRLASDAIKQEVEAYFNPTLPAPAPTPAPIPAPVPPVADPVIHVPVLIDETEDWAPLPKMKKRVTTTTKYAALKATPKVPRKKKAA